MNTAIPRVLENKTIVIKVGGSPLVRATVLFLISPPYGSAV